MENLIYFEKSIRSVFLTYLIGVLVGHFLNYFIPSENWPEWMYNVFFVFLLVLYITFENFIFKDDLVNNQDKEG